MKHVFRFVLEYSVNNWLILINDVLPSGNLGLHLHHAKRFPTHSQLEGYVFFFGTLPTATAVWVGGYVKTPGLIGWQETSSGSTVAFPLFPPAFYTPEVWSATNGRTLTFPPPGQYGSFFKTCVPHFWGGFRDIAVMIKPCKNCRTCTQSCPSTRRGSWASVTDCWFQFQLTYMYDPLVNFT